MRGEFIPHFFLLPQMVPLVISCSIRGWSAVAAHPGGCWATYRSSARMTAELPTVHPSASEASWFSSLRMVSASWVNVWERTTSGCFWGVNFGRAINRDHISLRRDMLRGEQIVTRTTSGRAQCFYPSFDSDLSLSLKRDNFDAKR
jgi:hypothetical protein